MSSRSSRRARPASRPVRAPAKRPAKAAPQRGRRWLWWAIGVASVVALVAVAMIRSTYGGGSSAQVTEVPAPSGEAAAGSGQVGERLARYSLVSIDGQPVRVPAGKPGAVFFMAGWCGPCLAETAALNKLERRLGDRISVLAVSPDPSDSVSQIRQFQDAAGDPRFPFAWDRQGTLARALAVSALDTTLVYNARGEVIFRDAVPTDLATLEAAFREAGAP